MKDSDERGAVLLCEALDLLDIQEGKEDRDQVRVWIEDVARRFRSRLRSQEDSPNFADLKEQFEQLSATARKLARLLEQTWPHVHAAAAGYCSIDDWFNPEKPSNYEQQLILNPDYARTILPEIADVTDRILERLPEQKGGERNVEARFHGLPKELLAIQCWELFNYFRPGKAKATEGGDYHKFTSAVYELSTGEDPDRLGVGLERYVKSAAVVCRDLVKRKPVIERLTRILPDGDSPVGLLSESGILASHFDIPQRMWRELQQGKK